MNSRTGEIKKWLAWHRGGGNEWKFHKNIIFVAANKDKNQLNLKVHSFLKTISEISMLRMD